MEEQKQNKFISVTYRLYTKGEMGRELIEEAPVAQPFQFISGFGFTLDAFEQRIIELPQGSDFDFELTKDEAYGDFDEAHVIDLDREIFTINGHFDHEHIYKDAVVPLQNEDGNRFYGRVVEVGDDKVKMDLNHPLAGKTINFKGRVLENREATTEEIQRITTQLSEDGCGCDECEGHQHEGHCGCGHCH
ncbi:MAG: peptidylprolyl isomerase [Prevotella sp.]|nr:peptidylprolyl isomerase [Prevotella sp.]